MEGLTHLTKRIDISLITDEAEMGNRKHTNKQAHRRHSRPKQPTDL